MNNRKILTSLISLLILLISFYFINRSYDKETSEKFKILRKEYPNLKFKETLNVSVLGFHNPSWLRKNPYIIHVRTTGGNFFLGTDNELRDGITISDLLEVGDSLFKKPDDDTLKVISDNEVYYVKIYTDHK